MLCQFVSKTLEFKLDNIFFYNFRIMKKLGILLFCCICSMMRPVKSADLYSSMNDMAKLYDHETKVMSKVDEHIREIDKQLETLDKFLDHYYKVSSN
jgi:hypothetical protein